jgi:hypothetical protein
MYENIEELVELLKQWSEAYEMRSADQAGGLYRRTQEVLAEYSTPEDIGD